MRDSNNRGHRGQKRNYSVTFILCRVEEYPKRTENWWMVPVDDLRWSYTTDLGRVNLKILAGLANYMGAPTWPRGYWGNKGSGSRILAPDPSVIKADKPLPEVSNICMTQLCQVHWQKLPPITDSLATFTITQLQLQWGLLMGICQVRTGQSWGS